MVNSQRSRSTRGGERPDRVVRIAVASGSAPRRPLHSHVGASTSHGVPVGDISTPDQAPYGRCHPSIRVSPNHHHVEYTVVGLGVGRDLQRVRHPLADVHHDHTHRPTVEHDLAVDGRPAPRSPDSRRRRRRPARRNASRPKRASLWSSASSITAASKPVDAFITKTPCSVSPTSMVRGPACANGSPCLARQSRPSTCVTRLTVPAGTGASVMSEPCSHQRRGDEVDRAVTADRCDRIGADSHGLGDRGVDLVGRLGDDHVDLDRGFVVEARDELVDLAMSGPSDHDERRWQVASTRHFRSRRRAAPADRRHRSPRSRRGAPRPR